jgi:phosphoglycerate dehydrogenase-like enzyme
VDPDVEVLFSSHPPAELSRTPRLRWLQMGVAGVEHLDLVGLERAGIRVTNASGIHAIPIAEYVLGMLLHIAKGVEERQASQRQHDWPRDSRLAGRLLRGRTILIVGYGNVGREIGRVAHAMGMRILAVKATAARERRSRFRVAGTGDPPGRLPDRVVKPADLAAAASEADYVVVTTPATPATRGLVSASVLRAMRPDAWLINVGRGVCVDTAALEAALRAGSIGGAVLDVFEEEPLPVDSPFWDLPNCIVTPHISGGPPGAFDLLSHLLVDNLTRYVDGRPLLNVVSARRGY